MLGNVLDLTDRHGVGRHPTRRRSRRLAAEVAEIAEIDRWLATMRSGPELVLYSAHPASAALAPPAPPGLTRRAKKRRR